METGANAASSIEVTRGPSINLAWAVNADSLDRPLIRLTNNEKNRIELIPAGSSLAMRVVTENADAPDLPCTLEPARAAKMPRLAAPGFVIRGSVDDLLCAAASEIGLENETGADASVDVFVLRTV